MKTQFAAQMIVCMNLQMASFSLFIRNMSAATRMSAALSSVI